MYTVVGNVKTRTRRVLWLLEELGEPYDYIPALPRSDEIRALNESGKVPALIEDGETVTDSVAIMTYLADKHGKFTYPAGTLARAQQDAVTQCINDELDAVLWTAARHSFVLPEEHRCPEVKASLRWEFSRNLARIAKRLGDGPFLMGQDMTIPDMLLTHCVNWAENAKFAVDEPALLDFAARMSARPAYQRVVALET